MANLDGRTLIVSSLLAGIAAVFRTVARAEEKGLTVEVKEIDHDASTAKLLLMIVPKETWFVVEGNVEGLTEGQIAHLEIKSSKAHLDGRELPLKQIVWVP